MSIINFVWDELGENILMELDENGVVSVVYENEPTSSGERISQWREDETTYYHFDGQKSTRQLTTESEVESDTYRYSAFGELVTSTGNTLNSFRYRGADGFYSIEGIDQIYVRPLMCSPSTSRWLSANRDPSDDNIGSYVFQNSNPITPWNRRLLTSVPHLIIQEIGDGGDVWLKYHKDNFPETKCGVQAEVQWFFGVGDLRWPPCTGYVVQRLDFYCKHAKCDCAGCSEKVDLPTKPETFYEACYVRHQFEKNEIKHRNNKCYEIENAVDKFGIGKKNSCGKFKEEGKMKFFCKNSFHWYKNSTGDIGGKTPTAKGKLGWKRLKRFFLSEQCDKNEIGLGFMLLYKGKGAPDFWSKRAVGDSAEHWFSLDWECCENAKEVYKPDAFPKK